MISYDKKRAPTEQTMQITNERQQDQCERLEINEAHLLQHYTGKETRRFR